MYVCALSDPNHTHESMLHDPNHIFMHGRMVTHVCTSTWPDHERFLVHGCA